MEGTGELYQAVTYTVAIGGLFSALTAVAAFFINLHRKTVKEPIKQVSEGLDGRVTKLEETTEKHEQRLEHVEGCLHNDNLRLKNSERAESLLLRSNMALLSVQAHKAEDEPTRIHLEECLHEIENYLIER